MGEREREKCTFSGHTGLIDAGAARTLPGRSQKQIGFAYKHQGPADTKKGIGSNTQMETFAYTQAILVKTLASTSSKSLAATKYAWTGGCPFAFVLCLDAAAREEAEAPAAPGFKFPTPLASRRSTRSAQFCFFSYSLYSIADTQARPRCLRRWTCKFAVSRAS